MTLIRKDDGNYYYEDTGELAVEYSNANNLQEFEFNKAAYLATLKFNLEKNTDLTPDQKIKLEAKIAHLKTTTYKPITT